MSDSKQFPNFPQATWTCWETNLVPYMESYNCDSVSFCGGNSGSLTFNHSGPLSGHFAVTYSYDPSAQVLTLTITDHPLEAPPSLSFDLLGDKVYRCPPQ